MKVFFRSIDHRDYNVKHECSVSGVIDNGTIIVEAKVPIPQWVYDSPGDMSRIVLATRYADDTLTPEVSRWPCIVNVCVPEFDNWMHGPWRVLDIAELTLT